MSCFHPVKAYQGIDGRMKFGSPNRVFCDVNGKPYEYFLPCGKCIGCRLDYAKEWSFRCVHEAKFHKQNCFVTLTFNDDNLPKRGVEKKDLQDFFKRLRSYLKYHGFEEPISYLACGEYGSSTFRPHYHAIIFGWCPDDLVYFFDDRKSGSRVFKSKLLSELWPFGFSTVGADVTYECCNYVSRYVLKKQLQEQENEKFFEGLNRPFILSSRRPAIGYRFLEKFGQQIVSQDKVIQPFRLASKPPRYYDKKLKERYEHEWLEVSKKRRLAMLNKCSDECEMYRDLAAKEAVIKQKTNSILKGNSNV